VIRMPKSRPGDPDVYWRRRFFALAAGLAVLGLLAWAVTGASSARPTAATSPLHSHSPRPATSSPGLSPTPYASSTSPSPSASSPSPSPSPSGTPRHHAHGRKPASHAAARHRGSDCPAADVVVSMTASGNSFAGTARPEFVVSVVSTDSRTCTVNTGTRHLTLLIESGGVRVWNSADCAGKSKASVVSKLPRGVPLQHNFWWNRRLSAPGCRAPGSEARPGTYTATASDGRLHSHTLVFVLR
jgi:hypothetical protein